MDKNPPLKKGGDFEMTCFLLNAKPKVPPFPKGVGGILNTAIINDRKAKLILLERRRLWQ